MQVIRQSSELKTAKKRKKTSPRSESDSRFPERRCPSSHSGGFLLLPLSFKLACNERTKANDGHCLIHCPVDELSVGFLCPRWNTQVKNPVQGEPESKQDSINLLSEICSTIYFIGSAFIAPHKENEQSEVRLLLDSFIFNHQMPVVGPKGQECF